MDPVSLAVAACAVWLLLFLVRRAPALAVALTLTALTLFVLFVSVTSQPHRRRGR